MTLWNVKRFFYILEALRWKTEPIGGAKDTIRGSPKSFWYIICWLQIIIVALDQQTDINVCMSLHKKWNLFFLYIYYLISPRHIRKQFVSFPTLLTKRCVSVLELNEIKTSCRIFSHNAAYSAGSLEVRLKLTAVLLTAGPKNISSVCIKNVFIRLQSMMFCSQSKVSTSDPRSSQFGWPIL